MALKQIKIPRRKKNDETGSTPPSNPGEGVAGKSYLLKDRRGIKIRHPAHHFRGRKGRDGRNTRAEPESGVVGGKR